MTKPFTATVLPLGDETPEEVRVLPSTFRSLGSELSLVTVVTRGGKVREEDADGLILPEGFRWPE